VVLYNAIKAYAVVTPPIEVMVSHNWFLHTPK